MADEESKQRLAAIINADVVGYSRLLSQDRVGTIKTIKDHRKLFADSMQEYGGRIVDTPGDNILAILDSVSDAVNCGVEIQRELAEHNAEVPSARMMQWRIGIELGDIVEEEDGKVYGDGINVADRLQNMAEPGGVCISGTVYDKVQDKLGLEYESLGEHDVKNIANSVRVYRVLSYPDAAAQRVIKDKGDVTKRWHKLALAVLASAVLCAGAIFVWDNVKQSEAPFPEADKLDIPAAQSEKPSIAVLPFDNMSGDPDQEYFSDGITEEIITRLSLNPALTVIARSSTFHYKGKGTRIKQVSQELGATYVVEGSARKAGTKIRITAQLIDATTENHLWAETYDREMKDVIDLQDEISERVVAALGVKGWEAEQERAWRIQAESLNAYDFSMRGWWHYYRFTKEDNAKAQEMFKRSIDLDPTFALGFVGLGQSYTVDYHFGDGTNPELLDRAMAAAQSALKIDRSEPRIYLLLSDIYWRKDQWEQALVEIEKAIDRNQSFTEAIFNKGFILRNLRRYDESIGYFEKAIQLDPRHREISLLSISIAYRSVGRFSESIDSLNRITFHTVDPSQPGRIFCEMAFTYLDQWETQQNADPDVLEKVLKTALKSVSLDERSELSHWALCLVYLSRRQYNQAISEAKKTIAIGGVGWSALLGHVYNHIGSPEKAIPLAETALQNSPEDIGILIVLGHSFRLTGRHDDALALFEEILNLYPRFAYSYASRLNLLILLSESGRLEDAKVEAAKLLKLVPHFSVDTWGERNPMKDREQVKRDMAALRKAGLK